MLDTAAQRRPFDVTEIEDDIAELVGRAPLLVDRQSTHGSFEENARVSQALKQLLRATNGWGNLTDVERESMDMIALKFSRILSGRSMEKQHWEDVVGYGKLVEEHCR